MFVGDFYCFRIFLEHLFEERRQPLAVWSFKIGEDDDGHRGVDFSFEG